MISKSNIRKIMYMHGPKNFGWGYWWYGDDDDVDAQKVINWTNITYH